MHGDHAGLDGAFAASPDPILAFDPGDATPVDANAAALSLLGVDRGTFLEGSVDRFLAAARGTTAPTVGEAVAAAFEEGSRRTRWTLYPTAGGQSVATVDLEPGSVDGDPVVFAFLSPDDDAPAVDVSRRVLEDLHYVSMSEADTGSKVDRMLGITRAFLGMDFAYLTEIEGGTQRIERSVGGHEGLESGGEAPLSESYCQWTLEAGDPEGTCVVPDAGAADIRDHPAYERFGFESYIGRTVAVDGSVRGTVCFAGTEPREEFSAAERMVVDVVAGWIGTELTDRRRRRQLRAVFDTPSSFIGLLEPDGTLIRANSTAWELVDDDPENHLGEPFWTGPWWSHDAALQADVEAAIARARDGETVEMEAEHPTPDGDRIVVEATFRPILRDGEVETIVAHGVDVTERKDRERRLREQQRRLRVLVENAPIVLFSLAPDGEFLQSLGRGLETLGLEEGELVGENVLDVYGDSEALERNIRDALGGEETAFEAEFEGTVFRTWLRPAFDEYGGLDRVIGVSVDITEKRRQERRLEAINEATDRLVYATTPEEVAGTVVGIARDVLEEPLTAVWRYEESEDALVPVAATDAAAEFPGADDVRALPRIESGHDEMGIFEAGGMTVVDDYGSLEAPSAPGAPLGTVLFAPLGENGLLSVGSPEVGPLPEMERTLIEVLARTATTAMDRARREQKLARYREKLEQSNRNLQEFAYVASHDLQEPLRMVSSYVDLLAMEYGDELDDDADDYIEFAVDGAERMQSMIDALLDYSRVHTHGEAFEAVDAGAVFEDVRQSLELLIEESGADVRVEDLPTVRADRDQLGQVFQNLVENAIEHGGDDGEAPTVWVSAEEREDAYEFAVGDDGPGIPESQHDRIFEIFKQGGGSDDGTGIGLAVCERIVQRHDGEIWVESDPPKGSTFRFTLPKRGASPDSEND